MLIATIGKQVAPNLFGDAESAAFSYMMQHISIAVVQFLHPAFP
jgi:hypothetical protein